ncbi:O-antigen ligase family protein [Neolewinella antarctica]|uniref:O-antigen ligase-related domain-containing protein n=1 Tax=Neolewinella antarctica TaxID=442734 RepID=A0ABX0XAY8_9BACT|nr:O-antigen ligase family protein [Neolewinella antarctica]NJC26119.1 hypothetical protein [Neolewinella antarctica]
MSKLLILYIWALTFAHIGSLGAIRYAVIAVIVTLIIVQGRKGFISNSWAYNIGGGLYLISGLLATILEGPASSWSYVFFTVLNFLILPAYAFNKIPSSYLMMLVGYILLTLLTMNVNGVKGAASMYGNPNNLATIILCTSYLALLAFKGRTALQVLMIPVFTGLMFLTSSRTQLAAILLFFGLYFGQRLLRTHLKKVLFVALIASFVLYATLVTGDPFNIIGVVQENTIGHKGYRGLSERDVLLFASIDICRRFPFGVGWGVSGLYIYDYIGDTLSPHNTFAKVAVEGGVAALVGYLMLLLGMMYRNTTILSGSFVLALTLRSLFEASTPFSLSFVSMMLILPFFLNENSVTITSFQMKSKSILKNGV